MSIANNYRKLGKKARRAKKYKSNKKNGFYAFRGDSSRHTPNSGTNNCLITFLTNLELSLSRTKTCLLPLPFIK